MDFYSPIHYKSGTSVVDYEYSWENSVLFLASWFQYQFVCLAFSIGKPWKKSLWTNPWLSGTSIILTIWTVLEILVNTDWVRRIVNVKPLPFYFRIILLSICCGYGLIAFLFEKFLVPFLDSKNRNRINKRKYAQKVKDLY